MIDSCSSARNLVVKSPTSGRRSTSCVQVSATAHVQLVVQRKIHSRLFSCLYIGSPISTSDVKGFRRPVSIGAAHIGSLGRRRGVKESDVFFWDEPFTKFTKGLLT